MKKIMIVDDDISFLEFYSDVIKHHFPKSMGKLFEIVTCENGMEAIKMFSTEVVLLFTDIHMPIVDGIELINFIQKVWDHKIYIVVCTGTGPTLNKKEIKADNYFLKKVLKQHFVKTVKKVFKVDR